MNTKAGLLIIVAIGITTSAMAQNIWEAPLEQPQAASQVLPAQVAAPAATPAMPTYGTSAMGKSVYQRNGGQPFWITNPPHIRELGLFLRTISRHGLNYNDYKFRDILLQFAQNPQVAETLLTEEVLRLAKDVSVGRLDPRTVSADIKFKPRVFNNVDGAFNFLTTLSVRSFDALAPQHPQYRDLLPILQNFMDLNARGGYPALAPSPKTLKVGVADPVVLEIKKRLNVLGYRLNESDFFDEPLRAAIKEVQLASSVEDTGVLNARSKGTWAYFAVDSFARQRQIELTMEKLRWLPSDLGVRHIFVNIANQELSVVDPNLESSAPVRLKKVITGKPTTPTPSMSDRVVNVALNPKWRVPPSIMVGEKIPKLLALYNEGGIPAISSWLASANFRLVDRNDRNIEVDPYSIDWPTVSASNYTFFIVQDSGTDNALGVMKINLGNAYNIYMHDTDDHSLFAKFKRLLSHGCIRIQNPLELAAYLLEGSREAMSLPELENSVSSGYDLREERFLRLAESRKLPVYIMPVTTYARNGRAQFTNDVYDQNAKLLRALKARGYYKAAPIDARVE